MKLLIINGANLNLLGRREPTIYGSTDFETYFESLKKRYPDHVLDYFQSNIEGEIVDALQKADGVYDGVLLNAGGYSHTSVVIADAIAAIAVPVVEVHISSILSRQEFRHTSLVAPVCRGTIMGFGLDSYRIAIESFLK